MFAIKQLVDLVNSDDVGYMTHLVLKSCQVNIQLIIVVISQQLKHALVKPIFLHDCSHHIRVDELVHFFYRHIHAMVSRNMPFELQKVSSHVIDIDERELFVDIVLSDIDVVMVISILVQTRLL